MRGYRTEGFYVNKFGPEVGRAKYAAVCKERENAEKRKMGKSLVHELDLSTEELKQQAVARGDAVRCLECGFVGTRLQHTHFKYKCSGRVKNGREYKAIHPGSLVVAPNLAKRTGGTLENYKLLHGDVEGERLWEEYRARQALSNTFEYKAEKLGWNRQEYDQYNQSRASTLENFIQRHGVNHGTALWNAYIERQRFTTTREYFVQQYGVEAGENKYHNFCKARSFVDCITSAAEDECYSVLVELLPGLTTQVKLLNRSKYNAFDYGCIQSKRLIEFYGTYWHVDPRMYPDDYMHPQKHRTAKSIRARDRAKLTTAMNQGFDVFVIWEYDWTTDRENVINRVTEWWNTNDNTRNQKIKD